MILSPKHRVLLGFTIVATAVPVAAQSMWLNVTPSKSPSPRAYHSMAYDANRGVVVLFGGIGYGPRLGDTWEWDGNLWIDKTPATGGPTPRSQTGMVYDEKRKKIVMFGGHDGKNALGETWEWDGSVWKQQSPQTSPPARYWHSMCYDSHRSVIVMFGGGSGTWEFDGATWTDRKVPSPPSRSQHQMVYDAARRLTVSVGGRVVNGNGDTWTWNGIRWTEVKPNQEPFGSHSHAAVYDSDGEVIVSFGGNNFPHTDELFEWDGKTWTRGSLRNSPGARRYHAMAYDSRRRRIVLFGGEVGPVNNNTKLLRFTWELASDCRCLGEGHAGGGLAISCVSPPLIGTTFTVAFERVQSNGALFFGPPTTSPWINLYPPFVCRPGILYTLPLISINSVRGSGTALIRLPIPLNYQLIGAKLSMQSVSAETTGCLVLSDGKEVTLR